MWNPRISVPSSTGATHLSAATTFLNQNAVRAVQSYKIGVRCIQVRMEIIRAEINASILLWRMDVNI